MRYKKNLRTLTASVMVGAVVASAWLAHAVWGPSVDDTNRQQAQQVLNTWDTPADHSTHHQVKSFPNPTFSPSKGVFAVISIPRIKVKFPVYESVSDSVLSKGIGHYPGTAGPGQLGNFATAGHDCCRQTGSPYRRLGELRPGDKVIVATESYTFTYTVGLQRQCGSDLHVTPEPATGQQGAMPYYAKPERYDVTWPTPCNKTEAPSQRLITLTTCYPDVSKVHVNGPTPYRIIVWAILTDVVQR
jgi:sortase A